ncbi:Transthyretin-like family protein, partial [Ostertagia ostertagi]
MATVIHRSVSVYPARDDDDHRSWNQFLTVGPDLDDLMAEGTTDSMGQFLLFGHTSEIMTIDPKLNIYHDCDDSLT